MKRTLFFAFAFFASIFTFIENSSAAPFCACCAERGHYSITTRKLDQTVSDEVKKLKFGSVRLYTDAGYPETIKGIKPLGESYTATGALSGSVWRIVFKDNQAQSGTLDLAKPLSMIEYMVDQTPLAAENAGEPILYKEWRFKYALNGGTGIFQDGYAPKTDYFLVLQGKGNVCTSAVDFTSWRLEINGKKAKYAFFGKIAAE